MSQHERDWSSQVDGYPPQLDRLEIMRPHIAIDDILAVQSLMMTRVRERARTTSVDETKKLHGMALLDTQSNATTVADAYDGSIDRYMSGRIKKSRHDQWQMLIRFFEAANTEAHYRTSIEERYYFDWLRNGNRAAWYTLGEKENIGNRSTSRIIDARPITPAMCDELRDEMWQHAKNHSLSRQSQRQRATLDL